MTQRSPTTKLTDPLEVDAAAKLERALVPLTVEQRRRVFAAGRSMTFDITKPAALRIDGDHAFALTAGLCLWASKGLSEARVILDSPCFAITRPLPPLVAPLRDGLRPPAEAARGTSIEAAVILGIKPRKLQAMSQRGEIPGAAKIKRQWTYDLAKLRRFVEQQEQATCQNEKPRPGATGATGFSMPSFRSGGDRSGGRLGQMIQQLQKRVAKQSKSGH